MASLVVGTRHRAVGSELKLLVAAVEDQRMAVTARADLVGQTEDPLGAVTAVARTAPHSYQSAAAKAVKDRTRWAFVAESVAGKYRAVT